MFDGTVFADQAYGGVSRYLVELARNIVLDGRMAATVHAPFYVSKYLDDLRAKGVQVQGRRLPVFRGTSLIARNLNRLQRVDQKYDVFHSSWYPERRPCAREKILAISVYDMIAELFPGEVSNAKSQSFEKKTALNLADVIFAISETTKKDLIEIAGVEAEKIVVTPLATSIFEIPVDRESNKSGVPYILYVGRRAGYKNFSSLLEAFTSSTMINSEFQLVCFGGENFSRDETERLRKLPAKGPGSVIRISGNDVSLAQRYAEAALFVCPSKYEGFGIPLLEAMACGCPVVSTRAGSLQEVGGNAPFYAPDPTPEALKFAMESILFDRSALDRGTEAGLRQARQFSWRTTAEKTVDTYLRHIRI
ncbi:glycosyltransferase family 1 protein [Variovorax sp. J31P179]|uniref:glycosyltransferase family 4 protein n=1 Tax=Variovorax sp. J31P179 TaxID=3053508 RepID=UPI002577323C|nr:glycosyltransferase family 1 protein [Variovorax sp. J31P179]MDM0081327.1 glycosyltransferase family 1 protein [Variovorax sp. J31P179]